MGRFGGGADTPEEHARFGSIDALTGYCACVALAAALELRRLTGKGVIARAAPAACGEMIHAQFTYDYEGRAPFDEPSGREVRGWGPFYQCYKAANGWMFLAAPTERGAALAGMPELADADEATLAEKPAERLALRPIAHWEARFADGSSSVVRPGSLATNRDRALQAESAGNIDIRQATYRAIRHDQHEMGRWVDLVAPNAVRPSQATIHLTGHAPKYGRHTREILARIGYSDVQINTMITSGTAGEKWSDRYLPE